MIKSKSKEFTERDLSISLRWPTISWSSMNAFLEYDKEKWYKQFVLGERTPPNPVMQIGIECGDRLITDSNFLKTLERPEIYEHNLSASLGDGVNITGHIDGWSPSIPAICEYKTSTNHSRWDQKKVDEWGQLTFYCLLVYIHYKIPPEKLRLRLWSIPIKEFGDFTWEAQTPICFTTKRTMIDIVKFGKLIKDTHKEMQDYVKSYAKII